MRQGQGAARWDAGRVDRLGYRGLARTRHWALVSQFTSSLMTDPASPDGACVRHQASRTSPAVSRLGPSSMPGAEGARYRGQRAGQPAAHRLTETARERDE